MMNDPKDPFVLTRGKVFLYGTAATAVLAVLSWFYVPAAPKNVAVSAPLVGPGSERARLGETEADAASPSAPSAPEEANNAPPAAASGSAEATYTRFCAQCHGDDGQGKTMMARMMEGKVPNLVTGPFAHPREVEAIAVLVRNGSASKSMPGFEKEIPAQAARELAAYVLAFPQTKAPKK